MFLNKHTGYNITQLKDKLKLQGLSTGGKKSELVARLLDSKDNDVELQNGDGAITKIKKYKDINIETIGLIFTDFTPKGMYWNNW